MIEAVIKGFAISLLLIFSVAPSFLPSKTKHQQRQGWRLQLRGRCLVKRFGLGDVEQFVFRDGVEALELQNNHCDIG